MNTKKPRAKKARPGKEFTIKPKLYVTTGKPIVVTPDGFEHEKPVPKSYRPTDNDKRQMTARAKIEVLKEERELAKYYGELA